MTHAILSALTTPSAPAYSLPSFRGFLALRKQRRDLRNLTPEAMVDLGLTQEDISAELKRSIFAVPALYR